jgi:hypothetical protein
VVSTPAAPNPYQTAAAQTQSNEQTAQYQQSLNNVNQITPYGSVNYAQTGTGADGAPITTATSTLSPELQSLVGSNISNNQAESGIEGQLANNAASELSTPLNLTDPSALQTTMDKQNAVTMDPQWAALSDQNDAKAYAQGLAPGSEGYANNQLQFNTNRTQAYGQMYGQNAQEAQSALMNQYNEPLNALNALKSGSQVSQPGVGQTASSAQTNVAGTNIAGLVEQNYQNQLSQSNAMMGGLFGLGGTALSALMM